MLSLAAGAIFTLTVVDNAVDGGNGLPVITSTMTINGNGAQIVRDPNAASFRLLDVSSVGALTVNNLALRNGSLFGGGGALLANSFVTLTHVSLTSNGAVFGGAVELNAGGRVSDSTFFGNSANLQGGGLADTGGGPVTLNNVTFQQNTAPLASGGGVETDGGAVTISGGAFISNTAGTNGGGLEAVGATLTLTNVTFSRNLAGDSGGGVDNAFGTAQITGVTFNGNLAAYGAAISNRGQVALTNVTVNGNSAGSYGGGIDNSFGTATLTNVTLSSNSATINGGEIYQDGGHYVQDTITLTDTVVANSASGGDCYVSLSSVITITSNDHNLASDTSCNAYFTRPHDQNHVAPKLGLLQNNSGPTWTMLPAADSPAVDHGGAVCPATPTDQRGVARPQGPACDIGAVERRPIEAVTLYLYLPFVKR